MWWIADPTEAPTGKLYVASRREGEGFGRGHLIDRRVNASETPSLVIGQSGHFVIGWTAGRHRSVAVSGAVDGGVGAPQTLATGRDALLDQVAVSSRGQFFASIRSGGAPGKDRYYVAVSDTSGRFAAGSQILEGGPYCGTLELTPDHRGGMLAGMTCTVPEVGNDETFTRYAP